MFLCHDKACHDRSSTAHDRAGRAKVGAHDSVASCCVAIEEAWVRTIGVCVRQGNYVATDLDKELV